MSKKRQSEETEILVPIDPETGMPTLPEGQFWRVTSAGDEVYIQIRKYTMFGSKMLYTTRTHGEMDWDTYQHEPVTSEDILQAAKSLVAQVQQTQARVEQYGQFDGDYPPRRLS